MIKVEYTIDKLVKDIIINLHNAEFNKLTTAWVNKFRTLSAEDQYIVIYQIIDNQSHFILHEITNEATDIYIPFIGKLELIPKRVVVRNLKEDDATFDASDNVELVKDMANNLKSELFKNRKTFTREQPIVCSNLGDVLKKVKNNK